MFRVGSYNPCAMTLSERQRKYLRGLGHSLKPIVTIGDGGLSKNVVREISNAVEHHELIKVRIRGGDRTRRDALIEEMCREQEACLITRIGHVALIYKNNPEKAGIKVPVA